MSGKRIAQQVGKAMAKESSNIGKATASAAGRGDKKKDGEKNDYCDAKTATILFHVGDIAVGYHTKTPGSLRFSGTLEKTCLDHKERIIEEIQRRNEEAMSQHPGEKTRSMIVLTGVHPSKVNHENVIDVQVDMTHGPVGIVHVSPTTEGQMRDDITAPDRIGGPPKTPPEF